MKSGVKAGRKDGYCVCDCRKRDSNVRPLSLDLADQGNTVYRFFDVFIDYVNGKRMHCEYI